MWEDIRSLFIGYSVDSMEEILIALLYGFKKEKLLISGDPPPSWLKICRFSLKKWETRINLILTLFTGWYGLYGELLNDSLNIFSKWVTFFTYFVLYVHISKTKSKKVSWGFAIFRNIPLFSIIFNKNIYFVKKFV